MDHLVAHIVGGQNGQNTVLMKKVGEKIGHKMAIMINGVVIGLL
jgi:tetrahydromethanopterin S-methyltransferase subunit G